MSTFSENKVRRQCGVAMIEALAGILVMVVAGAGTAQIAARIAVGQHEFRAESAVVMQLREMLNTNGTSLCGTSGTITLPGEGGDVAFPITCAPPPQLTVTPEGGTPVTVVGVAPITARVSLADLGINDSSGAAIEVGTLQ